MIHEDNREIWKIRAVKPYVEAHNHCLVGRVLCRDDASVTLKCRSFHFGRLVNGVKDVSVGMLEVRIIPWVRIEIVNVLSSSFSYHNAKLSLCENGGVVLSDGSDSCVLAPPRPEAY